MKKLALLFILCLGWGHLTYAQQNTAEFIQNFTTSVQRNNVSIGTSASAGALLSTNPNLQDVMAVNNGTVGVQIAIGTSGVTAVNTASAGGTTQTYIPAGAVIIFSRNYNNYYSAITDSGSGSLILHVGAGD